ncbi:leucine-rich repeat and transmembrane domain-containing protein 2 [Drosophila obscura]|uniref:leucine-rich repeat and transmembrane domain-containing protein 2 n=1 Tax=Drosophila obscura TaxID=7282 RepID=UPI001BB11A8D|nr:leucine-rich repeat and transmembrane domain-containing protein 2 [Drosophila obscura]
MHVYYKFGLLLIFLLSVSISHTFAAPAAGQQNNSSAEDYLYDDYDYSEETASKGSPETAENRLMPFTSSTSTTTTFRPTFNIPRRSNLVLEPSCPRQCRCLEDKYIQCSNAHLTHVPLDIPRTAAIIDLSYNVIAELRPEDFANLSRLVEINLNHNLLSHLDKEAFHGLERLRRLRLANNRLTKIEPDTFVGATDLELLDLSNNSISQRLDGSFLNQPSLIEFSCSNCSWTELPEQTFVNMSALQTLRLNNNNFEQKINTRAFAPLRNIIKLKLPELDQENIEELCNLLKSIDNISFRHFDVSCFELVLGTSFNESLIQATDPPFKRVTGLPTAATTARPAATPAPTRTANRNRNKMANGTAAAAIEVAKAGIMGTVTESSGVSVDATTEKEQPYQVPISQETINTLLICIMVLAVIGIVIGLICRKDVGGIKTKCCRTSKPEPKDQVHPTEEIPLNKLA